jgi:hypothetical protein
MFAKCLSQPFNVNLGNLTDEIMEDVKYPYCLMDGLAGKICFLSDLLLEKEEYVRFPGFEI